MNFLHLRFLQLITPNASICQYFFFSRATYFSSGCNESCCGLRREIFSGRALMLLDHSRQVCPSVDMAGREAQKECSHQLLSHLFCACSDSCPCFEVDFFSPPHLADIFRNSKIYKFKQIHAHFSLLLGFLVKGKIIRVGYWACSQSQSGLQQWWWY